MCVSNIVPCGVQNRETRENCSRRLAMCSIGTRKCSMRTKSGLEQLEFHSTIPQKLRWVAGYQEVDLWNYS